MNKKYANYPDLSGVKKILVVKLRHLGDVLLATPVFSNLKKAFPKAKIDAYVWKEAKEILDGHPAIENILLYDRKWKELGRFERLRIEFGVLREIRKTGYDLVINLTEGDRGAIVSWVSGAKTKVGIDPGKSGFFKKRDVYTHLVKSCPNPRHTVEKDLDALRRIGIFPKPHERELFFHVPNEAKESAKQLVDEEEFVLIHAASRWRFKCLPAPLMAQIIDQLEEPVVLTGAPNERELTEEIAALCKKPVVNLAGKTSLKELGALMQLSKGLITVDSVSLHLASALKTPVVALFGPTSEENWGPWMHPKSVVVSKNLPCRPCRLDGCGGSKMSDCLWSLDAEQVVRAWNELRHPNSTVTSSFFS